jgi:hypothetical protein
MYPSSSARAPGSVGSVSASVVGIGTAWNPALRTFGPARPPPVTPQDPTGAYAAAQAMGTADPRTWVPLRSLGAAHRHGRVSTPDATSLVFPMIELARSVTYGRGSSPPGWRSILPRPVLSLALRMALGEPDAVFPAPGGEIFDFAIGDKSGAGRAAMSSALGLALFVTAGVGWITTSHGHALARVRVPTADLPGGSTFQLLGTSGTQWMSLSLYWWRTVDAIHQSLLRLEARYLLGLVLFGPRRPPADLLTLPREALEAAAAPLVGPRNLAAFYPS